MINSLSLNFQGDVDPLTPPPPPIDPPMKPYIMIVFNINEEKLFKH